MKIRNIYVLVVNSMEGTAIVRRKPRRFEIDEDSLVEVYDCSYKELVRNLRELRDKDYHIMYDKRDKI